MENRHSQKFMICPSRCDDTAKLGIADTFALFMDIATEHAHDLGIGLGILGTRGLFWLTVRTRIRFHRRPRMEETVTLSTWPEEPGNVRCNRDYTIEKDGELLAEGLTVWGILNTKTGKLEDTASIYPEGLEILPDRVCQGPFRKIDTDFSACETLGEYTVRSTDVDLGGHMNNVAYLRALMSLWSCAERRSMDISEMEVTYRVSCYEGNTLTFKLRPTEDGAEIGGLLQDGTPALLVRMKYTKKEK